MRRDDSHPDFGVLSGNRTVLRQKIGNYVVVKPLRLLSYRNRDGYTTIVDEFKSVLGYGDSLAVSQIEALNHLSNLREHYGQQPESSLSHGAITFRNRLLAFLSALS